MGTEEKVAQLENEIKVLKNEVQAVLLDLRDKYLEAENPFSEPAAPPVATQQIVIGRESAPMPPPPPPSPPSREPAAHDDIAQDDIAEDVENEAESQIHEEKSEASVPARREARRARPGVMKAPGPVPEYASAAPAFSLVTVSALARWADKSVKKLGRPRTETILDVSEMTGHLSPELKGVLTRLIAIEPAASGDALATRDYFESLLEITSLLGRDNEDQRALLSILSTEDTHR